MNNFKRIFGCSVIIGSLLLQTACSQNYNTKNNTEEARNLIPFSSPQPFHTMQPFNVQSSDERIALASHQGKKYVPLQSLADLLGYQVKFDQEKKTIIIG